MEKLKLYRVPARCAVCGKAFMARYNTARRAKVCTPPSHVCKPVLVDGRKISCPQKCCRDQYRKSLSSMAGSPLDSRKYLTEREFKETRATIRKLYDPLKRMALWFILETGARVGEASLVRRAHLDWRPGKLSVVAIPTEKKIGHPALPVHLDNKSQFTRELRKYCEDKKPADALFPVGARSLQRTFERILKKIKPDRASLVHLLRHTRATRLAQSGLDPNTIRAEMRWESIEMLQVYSHTTEKAIATAFGKIRVK